jgi:hypothetical protein
VFGFGVAYLWLALRRRHEWLFIAIAAFGKLSFVAVLAVSWLTGAIPLIGAAGGLWDLVIGMMFVVWLMAHPPSEAPSPLPVRASGFAASR